MTLSKRTRKSVEVWGGGKKGIRKVNLGKKIRNQFFFFFKWLNEPHFFFFFESHFGEINYSPKFLEGTWVITFLEKRRQNFHHFKLFYLSQNFSLFISLFSPHFQHPLYFSFYVLPRKSFL